MSGNKIFQTSDYDFNNNSLREPSSKNIFKNNAGNIIYKDYSSFTLPNKHSERSSTNNTTSYGIESKLNELECKIIALEERNEFLLSRLNSNEQTYDSKIRKLEKNNIQDKNNIYKAEQTLILLSQKNNENSNELRNKISYLHSNLQREEDYKNEQRKLDLELQKNILNQITEKLGETVKAEVDARFQADMETKAFNQNIYKNMETDMNKLKKEIEDINAQVSANLKNMSKDCSERAHNLSKYIDQQMLNAVIGKNDSIDGVKKFVDDVIAQVKINIAYQNEQNKLFDQRLKNCEIHVEKSKNDNFGYMSEVEKRFDNKMKYLKTYFEINLQKHDNFLDNTIKNMAMTMDKNINFINEQIIETRIKENEVYEKMNEINENKFKAIGYDLEKVCERVYQYENLLNVFDKQNELLKKNISDSLAMMKSRLDVHIVNEKILYTIENDLMQEQVSSLRKKLENSNNELLNDLQKLDKGAQDSTTTLLLKIENLKNLVNKNDDFSKNKIQNLENRADENEVKQLMTEMMKNIENETLNDSLEICKKEEKDLNSMLERHQKNLEQLNNQTSDNKKATEFLNDKITEMTQMLNSEGSNISKAMDDIIRIKNEAKEMEMKESVSKLMDVMLTNIENEITNEKMDDMNKFNLQQMTANITNLKSKINTLTESTNSNSTDISSLKDTVEMIRKRGLDTQGNHSACSIKLATNQMLNNVEFSNIYSLLKDGIKNSPFELNEDMKTKFNELVDNKIKNELEKIKNDNQNMWINAVELTQKLNKPGEIKEIIDKVPPTILPVDDSIKRLLDVDYYNGKNSNPKVPDLESRLKSMESEQDENPENKEKKETEDNKEKDNENDLVQIVSSPDSNNATNKMFGKNNGENEGDKNSKSSSKIDKNSKGSKNSKNSKNSKGSKNSSKKEANSLGDNNSKNESENKSGNNEIKSENSKNSKGSKKSEKKSNSSKNKEATNPNNDGEEKNNNENENEVEDDEEDDGEDEEGGEIEDGEEEGNSEN